MKRALASLVLLAAGACATPASVREPPAKPFTATRWQLIMDIPAAGEQPYVRFGDGRVEGFGGCSRFAARYVQDTVGARAIAIGRMQVDKRLCDASRAAAESSMLDVLQAVSSYSVTGDVLKMDGSAGTLRFRAAADAPSAGASAPAAAVITGTRWKGVVDAGVPEAAIPWLEFVEGRVAGFTGCNMLSGPWRSEGEAIHVGPLVTTKRACPGAGGDVERRLLDAMSERATLSRNGSRLVATSPAGRFEFEEIR